MNYLPFQPSIIYFIKLINHLPYQTYKSSTLSNYKLFTFSTFNHLPYQTYISFTLSNL